MDELKVRMLKLNTDDAQEIMNIKQFVEASKKDAYNMGRADAIKNVCELINKEVCYWAYWENKDLGLTVTDLPDELIKKITALGEKNE